MEEYITVYPARLRGSQKRVPNDSMPYWITSLVLLTDKRYNSPSRGCLVTGVDPMTFEEWRKELGFHKARDAQRHWDVLFKHGAFEWHDATNGKRYVHLYGFERNQNRARYSNYEAKRPQGPTPPQQQEFPHHQGASFADNRGDDLI